MKPKLKKLRIKAGLTLEEVACAVNIAPSTYRRWELGKTAVPENKREALCAVLCASLVEIEGGKAPFDFLGVDPNISNDRKYFGEATIHFSAGGNLLLPLTFAEASHLSRQFNSDQEFLHIDSLNNSIFLIRKDAVDDIYLSKEAADSFGPDEYFDINIIEPNDDIWRVIENIENLHIVENDVDAGMIEEVNRLMKRGVVEEASYQQLTEQHNAILINLATKIVVRLSSGKSRTIDIMSDLDIYETFSTIIARLNEGIDALYIHEKAAGHEILIRSRSLDYIRLPKHKYNHGEYLSQCIALD